MITSEKDFIDEFQKHYNFESVMESVKEAFPSIDDAQVDYILSAVGKKPATPPPKRKSSMKGGKGDKMSLAGKIAAVKDMLPHLDDDYIQLCLEAFNNDTQIVINRILEENLPPHLQQATPPKEEDPRPSLIDEREGVHDYDEFDVLHRDDVNFSQIHIGKRQNSRDIINDRSHVHLMKSRGYDLIPEYDMYDDEYDDTYDGVDVGVVDQDSDTFTVKRLNQKGLKPSRRNWVDEEEEGDEEEEEDVIDEGHHLPKSHPFTIAQRPYNKSRSNREMEALPYQTHAPHSSKNTSKEHTKPHKRPELKQDEQRLTKAERKKLAQAEVGGDQRGRGGNQSSGKPAAASKKVIMAKQQEEDMPPAPVIPQAPPISSPASYRYKERHKSSRGNHNRKAMSDKKRHAAGWN